MKFEKDIFISYAHIDDESISDEEKGWITEFHRALEIQDYRSYWGKDLEFGGTLQMVIMIMTRKSYLNFRKLRF